MAKAKKKPGPKPKKVVETEPKKNGRPYSDIKRAQVEELLTIQCTTEEICGVLKCCRQTLYDWVERETEFENYDSFSKAYRLDGNASLRRSMHSSASEGNVQAQVFLAKNQLGMNDKIVNVVEGGATPVKIAHVDLADRIALIEGKEDGAEE